MTFENIILITTRDNDIVNFFNKDLVLCIDSIKDYSTSLTNKYHEEDSLYDLVCKKIATITEKEKVSGIVISFQLNNYNCFSIAHHIRLHNSLNLTNNYLPIILTNLEDISLSSPIFTVSNEYGILKNGGVRFVKEEKLLSVQRDIITGKQPIYEIIDKLTSNFNYENYLNNLKIDAADTTSRHQTSNEWGALRLSRNSGFSDDKIDYQYPPTLYFKYLSKKFRKNEIPNEKREELIAKDFLIGNKLKLSNHPYLKNKKILLIDDNSEKGWGKVLEKIFDTSIHCKQTIREVLNIADYDKYELVFLDLYLPDQSISLGQVAKENSLKVLSELKKKYPQVPIIIFTASNKSWTLKEVGELGADGMYVKESPEYAGDINYSTDNFLSFVNTISQVLDKYKTLRPYWESIQIILNNSNFKTIPEKTNTKFKERIEERLKMFYGLLKKGYEQSSYDKKTFFYSDYELAFMTLWSALNEIQEYSFIKAPFSFPVRDAAGNTYNKHPNSSHNILAGFEKWLYRADRSPYIDFYVELDSSGSPIETIGSRPGKTSGYFDFKFYSNFKQTTVKDPLTKDWIEQSPFFQLSDIFQNHKLLKVYEEKIILQIAFIIEKLNPTAKLNFYSSLIELNKIRNSLYLTHGSNTEPNFYLTTERQKRINTLITPQKKIKDLFNIVSLLLTGEEHYQLVI